MNVDFNVDFGTCKRAFDDVADRMRRPGELLSTIGEIVVGAVQENFERSEGATKWLPLSVATLISRTRALGGGSGAHAPRGQKRAVFSGNAKPLIFTGALFRSITMVIGDDYVDVGSPFKQSWRLFLGSSPGVRPVTPARNPLYISDQTGARIEKAAIDFFGGPLH